MAPSFVLLRRLIKTYNSTNDSYYNNICSIYEDIIRYRERIWEWSEEVDEISIKIQGKEDAKKNEEELRDVKKRLKDINKKKEDFIRQDESCKKEIEKNERIYDKLAYVSDKNKQIMLYIKYAEVIYEWIKDTYESKEMEIREQLELKVNEIFSRMYHGKRKVVIDDKYRVTLLTSIGCEEIKKMNHEDLKQ